MEEIHKTEGVNNGRKVENPCFILFLCYSNEYTDDIDGIAMLQFL